MLSIVFWEPPCADFVVGAALCVPPCADFLAGTAFWEPPCADFVAGAALWEPLCVDFVVGTAFCAPLYADFVAGTVLCAPLWVDFVAGAIQNALWRDSERAKCCIFQWNRWFRSSQVKVCGTTGARRSWVMFGLWSESSVYWDWSFHLFFEVQISCQVQHFGNLHVQISWQVQHFGNLHE